MISGHDFLDLFIHFHVFIFDDFLSRSNSSANPFAFKLLIAVLPGFIARFIASTVLAKGQGMFLLFHHVLFREPRTYKTLCTPARHPSWTSGR